MKTTYRFRQDRSDHEVYIASHHLVVPPHGMVWVYVTRGGWTSESIVHRDHLVEVPPPIPAEPPPGAYLIGGVLCVRWWGDDSAGHWAVRNDLVVGGYGWFDWAHLVAHLGGSDISIVSLVPKADLPDLPEVELPWTHVDNDGDRTTIGMPNSYGVPVEMHFHSGNMTLTYLDTAESRLGAAAAILAGHKAIEEAAK